MRLDMFDIGNGPISIANSQDLRPYQLMNRYGGLRNASQSSRAFLYPRDVPDLADTVRFNETYYGPLVPPAQLADSR
jgi:hypothetical protein